MATKAQAIYDRVQKMTSEGVEKSDAFKTIAEEEKRPYDSVRGSYYSHKTKIEGGTRTPRPRRRETTEDAALEDARASLVGEPEVSSWVDLSVMLGSAHTVMTLTGGLTKSGEGQC